MRPTNLSMFLIIWPLNFIICDTNKATSDISTITMQSKGNDKVLSRKKRYLVFPTGASFSVATCMTVGIYGNPQFSMFSWGLNWGFAYELPTNASYFSKHEHSIKERSIETKPMLQRRHRRDLFNRIEIAMKDMGYDGRDCVLRALCEVPQMFGKRGSHLVAEIIRTIFSMPKSKVLPFEHPEMSVYDDAFRRGRNGPIECSRDYPKCGFSLIKLALGKYSKPLKSYM